MKIFALLFVVGLCSGPFWGLCQSIRQSDAGISRQTLRYGGGDSGGGSGIFVNGSLILKDFTSCTGFKSFDQYPAPKAVKNSLAPAVSEVPSDSVKQILKDHVSIEDPLVARLLWAAAARSNWYLVQADLNLEGAPDAKLAIFKRPLGILSDETLFAQLSPRDQVGLFLHETLRMVSIGFDIPLSDREVEQLTCDLLVNGKFESRLFPTLAKYLENLRGSPSNPQSQARQQMWLATLESMAELKDVPYMPMGSLRTYFYQTESSKFEMFRTLSPHASAQELEHAFFGWASVQAPMSCSSYQDCAYHEIWQKERWDLFINDSSLMGWSNKATGFSFIVTKKELDSEYANTFCRHASKKTGKNFKQLNRRDLHLFSAHPTASLVINRSDLTSMEANDIPLLAHDGGTSTLWSPDDSKQGYNVISSQWESAGRVLCLEK